MTASWVLILTLVVFGTGNGASVATATFNTQEACIKAADAWLAENSKFRASAQCHKKS